MVAEPWVRTSIVGRPSMDSALLPEASPRTDLEAATVVIEAPERATTTSSAGTARASIAFRRG